MSELKPFYVLNIETALPRLDSGSQRLMCLNLRFVLK